MQTYWDLTEKERAALEVTDVDRYIDAELMLKGVLKVPPLVLVDLPKLPPPDHVIHRVRIAYRTEVAAFESNEKALEFIRTFSPLIVESHYVEGQSISVASKVTDHEILTERVYSAALYAEISGDLKRASAIKTTNDRKVTAYTAAMKLQEEALKGLWSDWVDCREKAQRVAKVQATAAEYRAIAGTEEVALQFLSKVFDADSLREAAEWGVQ